MLVGITGGIGSGKSTISKIFESLGVPVFNSDEVAKNSINTDKEVIEKIIHQFGDVYHLGKIDAEKMAQLVFNDKNALEKLNHIIHPKVRAEFKLWIIKNSIFPILIQEAAILIESGAYKNLDKIILVVAPLEERIRRVMNRDGVTEKMVRERIQTQSSDQEKMEYANYCITNDGKQLIIPQVIEVFNKLKKP
ncbi:MAG: dephospho-CoA kinase [Bacteroidetes bacterium RIFCSPLOWO2_12_FULL_31_6]|nr:MAG: dephospho-CoA kinase [Bacteroidetes bacterium RIFCSPLOWO2_12_FULL_31_6]